MVRQVRIQTNKSNYHDFNGFQIAYPEELYSSLPIREYHQAIEFINSNTTRSYSSILIYVIICIVFGLLPIFILLIIELIRSTLYKNRFEKDLKNSLEQVNNNLKVRNVYFSYKFHGKIRKMQRLELIISYPDITQLPEILGEIVVSPEGRNLLVIQPAVNPIEANYKITSTEFNKKSSLLLQANPNYLVSKIAYIVGEKRSKGIKDDNFYGFQNEFDKNLYNFMLESEYQSMIKEFNTVLIRKIDIKKELVFVIISTILLIALIGFILIIPALILYSRKRSHYYRRLYNDLGIMVHKYSSIYNNRGITISYKVENIDFDDSTSSPLINLLVIYPKAPIGSPILTNFVNNPYQWVVAPSTAGGNISPFFTTQSLLYYNTSNQTNNYQTQDNLNYYI